MSRPRAAGTTPAADQIGEVTRLLKEAAYFPILNEHDPSMPNQTVPLLPFGLLSQQLFTAVDLHEGLRRFEVVTQVGPDGLSARNRVSQKAVARLSSRWTPIPEGYIPSPGASPPPTLLNPFQSQRFTMLNGQLSFDDRRMSRLHTFGTGRTFPIAGSLGSLNIGAVIDVLQGFGSLQGLSGETLPGATMVINGCITPPNDLSLNLVVRVMDPDGRFKAEAPVPPMVPASPAPAGSGTFLHFLGEPDPRRPIRSLHGPDGSQIGAQIFENLRLVQIGFDAHSLQSSTREGPIVGTASANLYCGFQNQFTVTPAQSMGGVFTFHDLQGRSLGSVFANMVEGRAFRTFLPGAAYPVFRMGGFGPLRGGTGTLAGVRGMMSVNGIVSSFPPSVSNLYVLRLEDPDGRFQERLQGAGLA